MILNRKRAGLGILHFVLTPGRYSRQRMRPKRRLRGLPLAAMAAAGVVLGHWLTYRVALPNVRIRSEILAASGHGYWLLAVRAAVVLALVSLATVFVRHLDARDLHVSSGADRLVALAARLALVQVTGFLVMEVAERFVVGAPVLQLLGHHLFVLGLLVQVLVAFAGSLVLLWFGRAVASVVRILSAEFPREPAVRSVWPPLHVVCPPLALAGAGGVRGPPPQL